MEMLQFPLDRHPEAVDGVDCDDLDVLQRRVGELWMVEPRGGHATRGRLLAELQELELEIERLSLLVVAGEYVPRSATTSCSTRFRLLQRRWSGDDLAA